MDTYDVFVEEYDEQGATLTVESPTSLDSIMVGLDHDFTVEIASNGSIRAENEDYFIEVSYTHSSSGVVIGSKANNSMNGIVTTLNPTTETRDVVREYILEYCVQ